MAYITSRPYLPSSQKEMARGPWYNMWKGKLWPYQELVEGDLVYWYESRSGRIVWVSHLKQTERFKYTNKEKAARRIEKSLGRIDRDEHYFKERPARGYCLAYKVSSLKRVTLPKPKGLTFRQTGWQRVTETIAQKWLRAW